MKKTFNINIGLAAFSGLLMLLAGLTGAQQPMGPDSLLVELDLESLEQVIADNLPPGLELPSAQEWQHFWNQFEQILQSQSLDDMAWFYAAVEQACAYLDSDPANKVWADFLRQRLDYFEMADYAVQEATDRPAILLANAPAVPSAPSQDESKFKPSSPVAPVITPAARKEFHLVMPVAPPAKAPMSPLVESKRHRLVRDSGRWQKRLADRPAPPNAALLIPRLKKVFQDEGLPPELVWIAEVESSLNPSARSPVGALGLFQLMPATARRFGLRTGVFDERKNPEKSARAAAQYMKILYRAMGSWPLALAAYNAGEGRVGRLIKNKETAAFESIARHLPLETQMYVPKVRALIALREKKSIESLHGI